MHSESGSFSRCEAAMVSVHALLELSSLSMVPHLHMEGHPMFIMYILKVHLCHQCFNLCFVQVLCTKICNILSCSNLAQLQLMVLRPLLQPQKRPIYVLCPAVSLSAQHGLRSRGIKAQSTLLGLTTEPLTSPPTMLNLLSLLHKTLTHHCSMK